MNAKAKALKKKSDEKDEYEMPKSKALSEHKRLVKVLKTKKGIKHEAKVQSKELKEIKGK